MTCGPPIRVVCVLAASCAFAASGCGSGNTAAQAKLDSDAVRVLQAIAGLGSRVEAAQSDLTNFPADLLSEQKDFAFIHPNLVETTHAAGTRSACTDAGNVQAAAQNVETDLGLVRDDLQTFDGDASRATSAIAQIRTDAAALRHGIATNDFTPPSAPTTTAVDSAISAARADLAAARLSVANYLHTAEHVVAQASRDDDQARAICAQR